MLRGNREEYANHGQDTVFHAANGGDEPAAADRYDTGSRHHLPRRALRAAIGRRAVRSGAAAAEQARAAALTRRNGQSSRVSGSQVAPPRKRSTVGFQLVSGTKARTTTMPSPIGASTKMEPA